MDEPIVTFGLLMGKEAEGTKDKCAGDSSKDVLLIFCQTGESEQGKIDVTTRMKDLALMAFVPVAIARWISEDTRYYAIFAKEGLSAALQSAVSSEAGDIVRGAIETLEL